MSGHDVNGASFTDIERAAMHQALDAALGGPRGANPLVGP